MIETYIVGRCINCGTYFEHGFFDKEFDQNNFCSKKCCDELTDDMNREGDPLCQDAK